MIAYVQLVGCILGPLLVTAILIYLKGALSKEGEPSRRLLKTLFYELSLHPEKGLADQGLLWVSILLPLIYFLTLGGFAWQGTTPSLSAEGFNTFIEISKLPLTLLALCVPLAVLVSRLHATKQTAAQLISTKKKNNYDLFLSHRKSMIEYFSAIEDISFGRNTINFKFHIDPQLHKKFFIANNPLLGIPEVNKNEFKKLISEIQEFGEIIVKFNISQLRTPVTEDFAIDYINISRKIYILATNLGLRAIRDLRNEAFEIDHGPDKMISTHFILGSKYSELMGSFQLIRKYSKCLCEFANYETNYFDEYSYHYQAATGTIGEAGEIAIPKSVISVANGMILKNPSDFLERIGGTTIHKILLKN